MAFGKREGSLLHGCQREHRPGSDDDDDDDDLSPQWESPTGIRAVFQTSDLLCTRRGVELIETESRIHT